MTGKIKRLYFITGISLLVLSAVSFQGIALSGDTQTVYVPELNARIVVFDTVWAPRNNNVMRRVLSKNDLSWARKVLDIGTGTGILGLIALKRGAGRVIATDINPAAVNNARYNAGKLGYAGVFEARFLGKSDF